MATATGLSAGTYSVTVTDANGCTAESSVVLEDPTGISATISGVVHVLCNGQSTGSATVSGSGGSGIYTYEWDGNAGSQTGATATGLIAGQYSVTVTDANGCEAVAFVEIEAPTLLIAEVVDPLEVSCNG